jgi:hypothetical protein
MRYPELMLSRGIAAVRQLLRGFWQPVGMCCGLDVKGLQIEDGDRMELSAPEPPHLRSVP